MSEALRESLKPGDLITATEDSYFSNGEYSQLKGHLLMVNNPRIGNLVGGTGLNGQAYNGRSRLGLGCSFRVGTFRLAKPDDPGYMATREQWSDIRDNEIKRLRDQVFQLSVVLMLCFTVIVTYSH